MDAVENLLRTALEENQDNWEVRLELATKLAARGKHDEASEVIAAGSGAPETEDDVHRAVDAGGVAAVPILESFLGKNPSSGWAHHVLGTLLQEAGEAERGEEHLRVGAALGVGGEEAADETPPSPPTGLPPIPTSLQEGPQPVEEGIADFDHLQKTRPKRKMGRTATAVTVAVLVHVVIGIVAALLVILPERKDEPEIVAQIIGPPLQPKQEMQKKTVMKQVRKTTSSASAAAPIAQLMRSNAMARLSVPDVTQTSTGPLGLGEGDFGSGGFGSGSGLGSGASFFGGTATGNRMAFVLDYSGSMQPSQMELVVQEMERSLKALKPNMEYQVILFAGGAKFAEPGWEVNERKKFDLMITGPEDKYRFHSPKETWSDFKFDGRDSDLPTAKWRTASSDNIRETMSILKKKDLFNGTDWRWAFKTALNLKPAPDVVFFMTDGSGGNHPPTILNYNEKMGNTQLNTFAMQTQSGAKEMQEIAKKSGGAFTIILGKGKTVSGDDYFKNKAKWDREINKVKPKKKK